MTDIPLHIGIYGKHPSFGDFVTAGLPDAAQSTVEEWLYKVLPKLRDMWGENWQTFFDAAPVINFWFGSDLTRGSGSLCGLMGPSRDKVGRRFPLMGAIAGSSLPPPPLDPDESVYHALGRCLSAYIREDGSGASQFGELLSTRMSSLVSAPEAPEEPGFWAARNDADTARLWADVAAADHARAAAGRSYLWCSGRGGSAVHVSKGLPDADAMAWLMTSAIAAPMPEPETAMEDEATIPPAPLPDVATEEPEAALMDAATVPPAPLPDLGLTDRGAAE